MTGENVRKNKYLRTTKINSMYKVIYLYILKCSDGSLYVGVTNNPERRLIEHNQGINPDSYTYSRRPVEIVFHEMFTDFNLAFEWETRIKKWSRAKKQALIDGDFVSLKELSKKKFKEKSSPSSDKLAEE
jgi:putative endonuclease